MREAVRIHPTMCRVVERLLELRRGMLVYPIVPREYPMVPLYPIASPPDAHSSYVVPQQYPASTQWYYPSELLASKPRGASAGRARTGRTGAEQLRAGVAGAADRVGVEGEPTIVALVKEAAAWQVRYRLTAVVGVAGCRGRTLARRLVDDPVISCRALIAPILAPRIAGCTRRRRKSGSNQRSAPHPNMCDADVVVAERAKHKRCTLCIARTSVRPCVLARMRRLAWLQQCAHMQRHATRCLRWQSTIRAERGRRIRRRSGGRDGCNCIRCHRHAACVRR